MSRSMVLPLRDSFWLSFCFMVTFTRKNGRLHQSYHVLNKRHVPFPYSSFRCILQYLHNIIIMECLLLPRKAPLVYIYISLFITFVVYEKEGEVKTELSVVFHYLGTRYKGTDKSSTSHLQGRSGGGGGWREMISFVT